MESMIVETVFSWNGIGSAAVVAISGRGLPADPGICYVDGMYLCTGESFGRYILPVA